MAHYINHSTINLHPKNCPWLCFFIALVLFLMPGSVFGQIQVSVTNTSCPNAEDGEAVVTIAGRPLPKKVDCLFGKVNGNKITELYTGVFTVTVTDVNGCVGEAEFEVGVDEQNFDIQFQVKEPVCGAKDGAIEATVGWGRPGYQFSWSSDNGYKNRAEMPAGSMTIDDIDDGTYTLSVIDGWGCFAEKSVDVERENRHPIMIDSIQKKDLLCPGDKDGEAEVFPNPNDSRYPDYKYKWSNGKGDKKITGLKGGEYTVKVLDSAECWGDAGVLVYEPPKLGLRVNGSGDFKYCVANHNDAVKATLTAHASGGTPPYSFPNGEERTYKSPGYHCKTFEVVDSNNCKKKKRGCVLIIRIFCSWDPNEIIGEDGAGDDRWIGLSKPVGYTINYENDPELAQAAAQMVHIKLPVDPSLDIYSFRLDDFGFGSHRFSIPYHTAHYANRLDLRDSLGIYVDILAGIDIAKREAFWRLSSIDPLTGLPPKGINDGFLKVNDSISRQGEGFVSFSIKPQPTGTTGDSITARASIQFDYNDTIQTNTWLNRVDIDGPVSKVNPLPAFIYNDSVLITVTKTDIGSGVREVELYISENDKPFYLLTSIDADSSDYFFKGEKGNRYRFFSRAVDLVGNLEPMKNIPEASIAVINKPLVAAYEITHLSCYNSNDGAIELKISGGLPPYKCLWSNDSTSHGIKGLSAGEYIVTISDKTGAQISDTITIIQPEPVFIELGDDITLQKGEYAIIKATPGYASYLWSDGSAADSLIVGGGLDTLTYTYYVTVTDSNGCVNSDTIQVHVEDNSLDIIELSRNSIVRIFPNPTKGKLYLQVSNGSNNNLEISINDIGGNRIFRRVYENRTEYFKEEVDLTAYQKGNYILTIKNGKKVVTRKIVLH